MKFEVIQEARKLDTLIDNAKNELQYIVCELRLFQDLVANLEHSENAQRINAELAALQNTIDNILLSYPKNITSTIFKAVK